MENQEIHRKLLGERLEHTTNSAHMWHRFGIEPRPQMVGDKRSHHWAISALSYSIHCRLFFLSLIPIFLLHNSDCIFFWLTADQSPCFHLGGHLDSKQEETFSGLDEGLHSSLLTFLLDKSTHQMLRDFCPYPHEVEHWECKIRYLGQIPVKMKTVYAILHRMFSLPLRRCNIKSQILRAIYERHVPWTN